MTGGDVSPVIAGTVFVCAILLVVALAVTTGAQTVQRSRDAHIATLLGHPDVAKAIQEQP